MTKKQEQSLAWADDLADLITEDFHADIRGIDILDYLAILGIEFRQAEGIEASLTYQEALKA